MNMIALFNFIPNYCPLCGKNIRPYGSLATADYLEGLSHTCSCGLHYQYIKDKTILDALEQEESDMPLYLD